MGDATSPSDLQLIEQAQEGDADAFGRLVERHQDYIYNAVRHLVGHGGDADDIAQEVFVKAYRNLRTFAGRARFTTWLYGIMLNTVRSFWRKRKRRATLSLTPHGEDGERPTADPPDTGDGPAELTEKREQVEAVRAAIAGLDDDLREIIVLRDIQGLSYEDLADSLGVPAGTVKSRLHRARHALKRRLEPLFGGAF